MTANSTAPVLPAFSAEEVRRQFDYGIASSIQWLHAHWLQVVIAIGIAAVIVIVLHLARHWGMKLCEKAATVTDWKVIAGRAIARTNNFFIVMLAAKLVAGYAVAPPVVTTTIDFLFTIAAVFQAAIWAREVILSFVELRTTSPEYHHETLGSAIGLIRVLVTIALFAIALIVVLGNLGVNVTGLIAGFGIGGIAIGLAAQGIFADLFAALAIIFDRPFRRGDQISYDTSSGKVEAIGLKSTRIRAYTGELRVIANKVLLDKEILNVTLRDHIRFTLTLGVALYTPPDALERIPAMLREIVEANGAVAARAGISAFSPSTLDFELIVDVPGSDWGIAHPTRDRIAIAILRRFAEENIHLAYPTQTAFTAAPDGQFIMPYPEVQAIKSVGAEPKGDGKSEERGGS